MCYLQKNDFFDPTNFVVGSSNDDRIMIYDPKYNSNMFLHSSLHGQCMGVSAAQKDALMRLYKDIISAKWAHKKP